jgi:hypothetical protein
MAMLVDNHLVVGTARGARSDWFRNLQASPDVRYWLDGEPHNARALAFAPDGEETRVGELPAAVQDVVHSLTRAVDAFGCRFAVLVPTAE